MAAVVLLMPQVTAAQRPASAPARDGIVFVGSSIFHRWTNLTTQMAPLPVVNRAFDGAQTDDMLQEFARVLKPVLTKALGTPATNR